MKSISTRRPHLAAIALGSATALSCLSIGRGPVVADVGGPRGFLLQGSWSDLIRAGLDRPATADGVTSFYCARAGQRACVRLPVGSVEGPVTIAFRGTGTVRHLLSVFVGGRRASELLVETAPRRRYELTLNPEQGRLPSPLEIRFALTPRPLVNGDHRAHPARLIDRLEVASPGGLRLDPPWAAGTGLLPIATLASALALGCSRRDALAGAVAVSIAVQGTSRP